MRHSMRGTRLVVFLTVFIDLIGFGMVMPLLPLYGERFGPSPLMLGLLLSSFSICQFVAAPILGRLSDRIGRRPVLIASLAGSAIGYAILAAAQSLPLLFVARIIDGFSGGNISTAQAVIADTTAPGDRAKGMGLIGMAFGLGFVLGPFLGGILATQHESLPSLFAALLSLIAMTLAIVRLPETRPVAARAASQSREQSPAQSPARSPARQPAHSPAHRHRSLAALAHALARPRLGIVLAALFLWTFAFSNFEATFSQFLHAQHGFTPARASWLFAYAGLIAAAVQGAFVGPLAGRFSERRLAAIGGFVAAAGLVVIPHVAPAAPLFCGLALLAGGIGLLSPSVSALASRLAAADEQGGVLGIAQSFSSLARIAGPIAGEALYGGAGPAAPFVVGGVILAMVGGVAVARFPGFAKQGDETA